MTRNAVPAPSLNAFRRSAPTCHARGYQRYLAQAHTHDYLSRMSDRGWEEWGPVATSAACVVRAVSAVLSGSCANAVCLMETPGRHAASGAAAHELPSAKAGDAGGEPCAVNVVAVGALYAHLQW